MASQIKIPDLSDIPEAERTRPVLVLLEICHQQQEQIHLLREQVQGLKDEIARLKGHNPKPKIKPSRLEQDSNKDQKQGQDESKGKRPGSAKKSKNKTLKIHKTVVIQPADVPEGSRFKGYADQLPRASSGEANRLRAQRYRPGLYA